VTDDLVTQLLAAIEETERVANDALRGYTLVGDMQEPPQPVREWRADYGRLSVISRDTPSAPGEKKPLADLGAGYPEAWHIVVHQPNAVLRRCAADRKIVELHEPYHVTTRNDGLNWDYRRCGTCEPADRDLEPDESYWPCPTIVLLAEGYGITTEEGQ
jgi:hypothetical protein